MKPTLLILLMMPTLVFAQHIDTTTTDTTRTINHWDKSGNIASIRHLHTQTGWGHVEVFDPEGNLLLHLTTGRSGGSRSASTRYHRNGTIRNVSFHFQPDGGIQWSEETWEFDSTGALLRHREDGYDYRKRIVEPSRHH